MEKVYKVEGKEYVVVDTEKTKIVRSEDYNRLFHKNTGLSVRWGKNREDDPTYSPIGPEILDIEVSINGCRCGCKFCYKDNSDAPPTNMSLETFKKIIDKFTLNLEQVALGITDINANPDFVGIMEYCRSKHIIPNFTLTGIGMTDYIFEKSSKLAGALAVSVYPWTKDLAYDTIERYTKSGMKQVNIHLMISEQTKEFTYKVLNDIKEDKRLKDLNAIVFLGVKPKGRARGKFNPLNIGSFTDLFNYCRENSINYGFDSCTAPRFVRVVENSDMQDSVKDRLISFAEPCESDLFSSYINVHGELWHCSFTENEKGFKPVSLLECEDFLKDVWYSEEVVNFRNRLITQEGCRQCPVYPELSI